MEKPFNYMAFEVSELTDRWLKPDKCCAQIHYHFNKVTIAYALVHNVRQLLICLGHFELKQLHLCQLNCKTNVNILLTMHKTAIKSRPSPAMADWFWAISKLQI